MEPHKNLQSALKSLFKAGNIQNQQKHQEGTGCVSDSSPLEPDLFILSPLQPKDWQEESVDDLGPEVCLATGFRPKDGEMVLNVKKGPLTLDTSKAVLSQERKSYFFPGFTNRTIHSCELHNSSANNENLDLCHDLYPEKAKLNFFLVLMNGVRVVFTKALAFNTVLTIRALLF